MDGFTFSEYEVLRTGGIWGAWHGPWKESISEDAATGISFFTFIKYLGTRTSNSGLLIHSDFWVWIINQINQTGRTLYHIRVSTS